MSTFLHIPLFFFFPPISSCPSICVPHSFSFFILCQINAKESHYLHIGDISMVSKVFFQTGSESISFHFYTLNHILHDFFTFLSKSLYLSFSQSISLSILSFSISTDCSLTSLISSSYCSTVSTHYVYFFSTSSN